MNGNNPTKIVILLFTIIFSAELALMLVFNTVVIDQVPPWGFAALDGIVISVVSVIAIFFMNAKSLISLSKDGKSEVIVLKVAAIIFSIEAIIMFLFSLDIVHLSWLQQVLIDSVLLSVMSVGLIYYAILRLGIDDYKESSSLIKNTLVTNVALFVSFSLLLLLILYIVYMARVDSSIVNLTNDVDEQLNIVDENITRRYQLIHDDLLFFANSYKDNEEVSGGVEDYLKVALSHKKHFTEIMMLSTDDNRDLILRRGGDNGNEIYSIKESPSIIENSYFKKAEYLKQGEIITFISKSGNKGQPLGLSNMVLELVTTVKSTKDENRLLVLKIDASILLEEFNMFESSFADLLVVDRSNNWLLGDNGFSWGFLGTDIKEGVFGEEYLEVFENMKEAEPGTTTVQDEIYYFRNIVLNEGIPLHNNSQEWGVVAKFNKEELLKEHKHFIYVLVMLYLSFVIVSGFMVLLLKRAKAKSVTTEENISNLAYYDALTNLANRRSFEVELDKEIQKAIQNKTKLALVFLDLNKFKNINDNYGHDAGDLVIQETAERIQKSSRDCDIPCRIGGDEFAVILPGVVSMEIAEKVGERIIEEFNHDFDLGGVKHNVAISIGISIMRDDETQINLVKRADKAMYSAKKHVVSYFVIAS